jgi:long-subunit fatty acid transport protein
MRALAWAWCLALGLFPARGVRADPFHFQGIPLGQRALGFGGAFTGLADDPSAAYYNPAGLVWTGDSALSASLTLNAFDRQTIVQGYRSPMGSVDLDHDAGPSLPGSVAFMKRMGKRRSDGERAHAIGLSTFLVDQRTLGFDEEIQQGPGANIATLSLDRSWRTSWQGLSYAYRVSDHLSFGLTGFLSLTRNQYREELITSALGPPVGGGSFETQAANWSSYRTEANVKNLLTRFGVLYQVHPQVRLGLMVQPPCLHVRGRSSVRERHLDTDVAGATGTFFNASESNLPAHYPMPWEVRLGASYKPSPRFTLALDGSLYGPTGSVEQPVIAVGKRHPDPETGAVAGVGRFELERWHRKTSGNVAIGTEVVLWDLVALRAGLFTSLSAAPSVPRESASYYAPDIHRFGGAFSVGVVKAGYDLSLGVTGLWGRGDAMAYDLTDSANPYHRTLVHEGTLFVFLTGMRNAISKLAKHAEEKFGLGK